MDVVGNAGFHTTTAARKMWTAHSIKPRGGAGPCPCQFYGLHWIAADRFPSQDWFPWVVRRVRGMGSLGCDGYCHGAFVRPFWLRFAVVCWLCLYSHWQGQRVLMKKCSKLSWRLVIKGKKGLMGKKISTSSKDFSWYLYLGGRLEFQFSVQEQIQREPQTMEKWKMPGSMKDD